MRKVSFRRVDLEGRVRQIKNLNWLSARVSDEGSPLVIVNYAVDGKPQRLGLRLDLGKRVFLDDLADPQLSAAVAGAAPEIVRVLGEERVVRPAPRAKSAPRSVTYTKDAAKAPKRRAPQRAK